MKKILIEALDCIKIIIIALIITNSLNVFVFTLSKVQQSSMEPTLYENHQLVVDKFSYIFSSPKRGEIIVFIEAEDVNDSIIAKFRRLYEDMYAKITKEERQRRLVKRVIGLPGDIIDIKDGRVFVNDVQIDEPYLEVSTEAKGLIYPMIVSKDEYFCMGDNRIVSLDSRDFGPVPIEKIEGKILFRFWPIKQFGPVK